MIYHFTVDDETLEKIIPSMKFSEIISMPEAAIAAWQFREHVAAALSNELGTEVVPDKNQVSVSYMCEHVYSTFLVKDKRTQTRGINAYVRIFRCKSGDGTCIRMFAQEDGYRDKYDASPLITNVEYKYEALKQFDIKTEYELWFVMPYTKEIAKWEKERIKELSAKLIEFCDKRNIVFPEDGFVRKAEPDASEAV